MSLHCPFPLLIALALLGAATLAAGAAPSHPPARPKAESLAGTWRFRLDPPREGEAQRWYDAALPGKIRLPGSTDEAGYGTPNNRPPDFNALARVVEYTGPAWYEREVSIPESWAGQRITLFLERCHWETRVWVDGREMGMQDSLSVPHVHELSSALTPGRHRLTLRVDNTLKYDMGANAHSTSEQTQTNWNGVIGRIELRATNPVWVEQVQAYPDVANRSARVVVTIGNATGRAANGSIRLSAASEPSGHSTGAVSVPFRSDGERATVETTLPMGDGARLWDEFSPTVYRLTARLESGGHADEGTTTFGMRAITRHGNGFAVNGRRIFLRGTLDCCIYPLTGYPPTTVEEWSRVFRTVQSYGLNHVRYHSWCPPEAAFEAADRLGVYLQVEAPQWVFNTGQDPPRDRFIEAEARRMLDAYGNHPSFAILSMGNELAGDLSFLTKLVADSRAHDPRHLYTQSSGWAFDPKDDLAVDYIRGLHADSTDQDFREEIAAKHTLPMVSHEIGQWTVYPNLREIKKYTGVTRQRAFERVREDLRAKGLLDQADAFTRTSGRLAATLYKEEVEVMLRTGHGGFQLLDLHDFPGQGTALVGILDAFWDSKGLITPEEWRRFCGPTVPLARLARRSWAAGETITADVEVAHYGPEDLKSIQPRWTLTDSAGHTVATGDLPARDIPTGAVTPLGSLRAHIAEVRRADRLTLTVSLDGADAANDWDLWAYPRATMDVPSGVMVTDRWDESTRAALDEGRSVVLLPARRHLAQWLPGSFEPVFWSPIWFHSGALTMSVLCNPRHPALAGFPTEEHTDWQWYDLLENSSTLVLDGLPASLRPIVQVVDNFTRNHRLGNVFEVRVGKGRLLVSSIDLTNDLDKRPAASQLRRSLLAYAASDAFRPKVSLDADAIATLFWDKPPLEDMRRAPESLERAALHVKASVNVPEPRQSAVWAPEADQVIARREGFGYKVTAGTWRDEGGAAWHSGGSLDVDITCPKGFSGTLYVHLHDWNNRGRVADIHFEGRRLGVLDKYDGPGVWLGIPVAASDSADGRLLLQAAPLEANAHITEIALVPAS